MINASLKFKYFLEFIRVVNNITTFAVIKYIIFGITILNIFKIENMNAVANKLLKVIINIFTFKIIT